MLAEVNVRETVIEKVAFLATVSFFRQHVKRTVKQ